MTMLSNLFEHVAWADERTHAAIADISADAPERAEATRLYAHLVAAEHVWLSRLEGATPQHPVWPDLTLETAAQVGRESIARLRKLANGSPSDLSRIIEYRNSAGQVFRTAAQDILLQIALHGSYHRGQIAWLVRRAGGAPAATDYIFFVRDRDAGGRP